MDRALLERARAGDLDAFDVLVQERLDQVYRTAMAILGNAHDAQDATQETFVAAWRGLGGLRDLDRFDAWLGRVALNSARMTARRRRRVRTIEVAPVDGADEPAAVDAYRFDRAFDRLPVEQRWLLTAHHLEGLGLPEIAARLDIPVGTVKSRLFAARKALDRSLREDGA